ncbi:acetyltransferase-like isoleucine patch superfamily enzyme [Microbacterium sp. SORGH_AS428]|nr:acetyltransferase-like isoleucine patch superfamily enzyme [Microbacterium sp. SORGH_AS_0428]
MTFSTEPYLVTIGDHVSATRTHFETHDGAVWILRDDDPSIDIIKPITVGSNVYLGYGTIILPGVTIGDNVIVGAGSVVTKDIPENSVAAGVPARVIKTIDEYRAGVQASRLDTKKLSRQEKQTFLIRHFSR